MWKSCNSLSRRETLARLAVLGIGALAMACDAAPIAMTVHKDPSCGCCTAWAERMAATGAFAPTLVDQAYMLKVKARLRVPAALASCHTAEVGGFVIEGHVPPVEVVRLLRERPTAIIGLAVPSMPAGSPGMEQPDGRRDAYDVIAFGAGGAARPFARYD